MGIIGTSIYFAGHMIKPAFPREFRKVVIEPRRKAFTLRRSSDDNAVNIGVIVQPGRKIIDMGVAIRSLPRIAYQNRLTISQLSGIIGLFQKREQSVGIKGC